MEPLRQVTGVAAPLGLADLDTDRILPARFMRKPRSAAYADYCFHDMRHLADGRHDPEFLLNDPRYADAKILVVGANFGSGSSREGAVYALLEYGFRTVIAPKFGDIFAANATANGLLTIVLPAEQVADLVKALTDAEPPVLAIDLAEQTIRGVGLEFTFDVDPFKKDGLLRGLDEIDLSLEYGQQIAEFERRYRQQWPWADVRTDKLAELFRDSVPRSRDG